MLKGNIVIHASPGQGTHIGVRVPLTQPPGAGTVLQVRVVRVTACSMSIVIYQKPTCTTCRQVYTVLKESGVDFTAVDYYIDPIPKAKLVELLQKMGMSPRQLLRAKGTDLQDTPTRRARPVRR